MPEKPVESPKHSKTQQVSVSLPHGVMAFLKAEGKDRGGISATISYIVQRYMEDRGKS